MTPHGTLHSRPNSLTHIPDLEQGASQDPPTDTQAHKFTQSGLLWDTEQEKSYYKGEKTAEGVYHGAGELTFQDGSAYTGAFVNGEKHGKGSLKEMIKGGSKYDGEWKHDMREGVGVVEWGNGKRIEGTWSNDRLNGPADVYMPTKTGGEKLVKSLFFDDT